MNKQNIPQNGKEITIEITRVSILLEQTRLGRRHPFNGHYAARCAFCKTDAPELSVSHNYICICLDCYADVSGKIFDLIKNSK